LFAILLAGSLLDTMLGLWWADPVAALIMVPTIAKEGIERLQGKACDECTHVMIVISFGRLVLNIALSLPLPAV
jgi:hypothetical protein